MNRTTLEFGSDFQAWLTGLRRWFHAHPEPSFEEQGTQAKVIETLNALGIENRAVAGTGVVATVYGRGKGPTFALRTDMDALRIQEAVTGLNREYRSQNDAVMHACGHDGHMAMVLGAAKWLQENRDTLQGNVRLVFQPAEEVPPGGAQPMIAAGCLEGVDAIVCVHLFGNMPAGRIGFRPGPFMATCRTFKATIHARPGHHMCPQDCIDPIQIAARFISTIQTDLRLRLPPETTYVFGFGQVQAGLQHNQTPAEASVVGTFRTFDTRVSETIADTVRASLDGLMLTFRKPGIDGLPSYELDLEASYPVLVNTPAFAARAAQVLMQNFPDVDDNMAPNLGAEDFACYLQKVPGLFMFLGSRNSAKGIDAMNHSDRFDIDEDALLVGVRALLTLTRDFLNNPAQYSGA